MRADPARVARSAATADADWLLIALALVFIDRALMAWRWVALLDRDAGPLPPLGRLLRIFFVSTFLGTFLPAGIGGDAVRAWSLSKENVQGSRALASVLVDRLLGTVALVILSALGLLSVSTLIPAALVWFAIVLAAASTAGTFALMYSRRLEHWLQSLAVRLPQRFVVPASRLIVALRAYAPRRGAVALVLVASFAVNGIRVLQAYTLGRAVGLDVTLFAFAAFIPAIVLLMQLPITIYGLGTTQLAFWWFFSRVGVAEADAVALSVLFLGLGVIGLLPGGLLYLADGTSARASRGAHES